MVDIIREAEEDLQKEKLRMFWATWGRSIIAGCVGIVLGTAAITLYKDWRITVSEGATSEILEVVRPELGGAADVSGLLEIVDDLPSNQSAIARFIAIGDLMREDNLSDAAIQLTEIADDGGVDKLLRNLARAQLAAIYVGDIDKTSEDVKDVLKPIFGSPKSPWYAQAKLNMALALAHKDQNYQGAVDALKQLLEKDESPLAIKSQARKLRDLYMIKAQEKANDG